ncbi:MAG TPA: MFS transporter [Jatrophihabitans sp.]|nr:MFS transporter [Jatrophihabitans sp.]
MVSAAERPGSVGVWQTFAESPVAVKALFAGVFINRVGQFMAIFLVLYLTSKGHSPAQAAVALGCYGFGGVAGVLVGGVLADWMGARNATVVSMSSSAVLIVSVLYVPSYSLLLVVVALAGLMSLIFRPAAATLLSQLTPDDRQLMIFAIYRFGLNIGATAAPLLGYALYNLDHQHYTLLFWGEALFALVYAVLAQLTLPNRVEPRTESDSEPAAEQRAGYLAVLRDRRYLMFLIAVLFGAAVYVQYQSTLPLDIRAHHIAVLWYTVVVSLNGACVILLELPLTKLSQRWPMRLTCCLAFGLVGLGVLCYGLPLGPAVLIAGTLIWTMGEIVGSPALFAYPALAAPLRLRSRYIGSFQFMFGLGSALGPMIGGVLFVHLGHRVWPVIVLASLVATTLSFSSVRTPKPLVGSSAIGASAAEQAT